MTTIYGVDTDKPVSVYDVRDAIVACFTLAHSEVLDDLKADNQNISDAEFARLKELNVKQLIRLFFTSVGGDFEEPTKETMAQVIGKLQEFSTHFRNKELIEKHYAEIQQLMDLLQ